MLFRSLKFSEVLRNWIVVASANFIGAAGIALLVYFSGHPDMNGGAVGVSYVKIAALKCNLSFQQCFFSGMLCNVFVCLAVWMAQAGRSVVDKVVVIIFPITAFVACGFEHSIANMFLIPMGFLLKEANLLVPGAESINFAGFIKNLIPVILGNLAGGSLFVSFFYYMIYGRTPKIV